MKHTEYRQEGKMKRHPKTKDPTLRKIGHMVARVKFVLRDPGNATESAVRVVV